MPRLQPYTMFYAKDRERSSAYDKALATLRNIREGIDARNPPEPLGEVTEEEWDGFQQHLSEHGLLHLRHGTKAWLLDGWRLERRKTGRTH